MRLYRKVELKDGELVQFVGVYVTRWGTVDEPTDGFREATDEEMAQAVIDHPVVKEQHEGSYNKS